MEGGPGVLDALLSLDLLPALDSGECPVCHVLRQRLHRYIDWFLIETYNAPPLLDRLADSGGFCPGHFRDIVSRTPFWQTWQMSFVTEVLIRHHLALMQAIRRDLLRPWNNVTPLRTGVWRRLLPRGACPLCSNFRSWEAWIAEGLARLFADTEWSPRVSGAPVCVPHLADLRRLGGARDGAKAGAKALRDLGAAAMAASGNLDALPLRRFLCGDPLPGEVDAVRLPLLKELNGRLRPQRPARRHTPRRATPGETAPALYPRALHGCPVCLHSHNAVAESFASGRAGRSPEKLCRAHLAHLFDRTGDRPPALLRLEELSRRLVRLFDEGTGADDLPATCPVCDDAMAAEEAAPAGLAVGAELDRETSAPTGVICIRHLPGVIRQASPVTAALILERQEAELRALAWLLSEYHRKRDYRYTDEPRGEEQHAWRRALKVLAGTNEEWMSRTEGGKNE
jgi:hypothetical protein